MSPARAFSPHLLAALILVAAAGIYLGVRSRAAAQLVLSPRSASGPAAAAVGTPEVDRVREMDARLTASAEELRDPLAPVPRQVSRPAPRPSTPAPEPVVPPELRMMLFDQVNPLVQISVDGRLSGRLSIGQSFGGWRVDAITSDAAVVSKDGKQFSLSLRRSQ